MPTFKKKKEMNGMQNETILSKYTDLIESSRFGDIYSELTPDEKYFKQSIEHYGKHYGHRFSFLAFSSYYREISLVEDDGLYTLLWDRSYLDLVKNLVSCTFVDNPKKGLRAYANYLHLYTLEQAVRINNVFKIGLLSLHLGKCGDGFVQHSALNEENKNILPAIEIHLIRFSFFYQMSKYIFKTDSDIAKTHFHKIQHILQMMLDLGEDNYQDTEVPFDSYRQVIRVCLDDSKAQVELACDIEAVRMALSVLQDDIPSLGMCFLASMMQFKVKDTLSNIRNFLKDSSSRSQFNQQKHRVWNEIRSYAIGLEISKILQKSPKKYSDFHRYYADEFNPILKKFDEHCSPVERYFFSHKYYSTLQKMTEKGPRGNPNSVQAILRKIGWDIQS